MATYRLGETITFNKVFAKNTGAITEAAYSIIFKVNGKIKSLDSNYLTFTVLNPTTTVAGYIRVDISTTTLAETGNYSVELYKTVTGIDGVNGWKTIVGNARFTVDATPSMTVEL